MRTKENSKTMKATKLIKSLVDLVARNGDSDVIIDYDCRLVTGVGHDESDAEYDVYGWIEIQTKEEENHRRFYETLGWRKCRYGIIDQKPYVRTTDSGSGFLVMDGYEISIDTLLRLPKED